MDVWKAYKAPELTRLPSSSPVRAASVVVEASGTNAEARARAKERAEERTSTRVAISKDADFLKKLSVLQQSDATQFKHLLGEVGSNLKAAANSPSGTVGTELGQLADRILRVAKTGDLSSLKPEESTATKLAASNAPSLGVANAALAAYRRNSPQTTAQSATVSQALDYVLSAVNEASR